METRTRVIHWREAPKDWRERPEEFVYIGRKGPFGEGRWGTISFLSREADEEERNRVIDEFEEWVALEMEHLPFRCAVMGLAGKTLVGFDLKGKRSHGHCLAILADRLQSEHQANLSAGSHPWTSDVVSVLLERTTLPVRTLLREAEEALRESGVPAWKVAWKKAIEKDRELHPSTYQLVREKIKFDPHPRGDLD